jgi:hypothetical protein
MVFSNRHYHIVLSVAVLRSLNKETDRISFFSQIRSLAQRCYVNKNFELKYFKLSDDELTSVPIFPKYISISKRQHPKVEFIKRRVINKLTINCRNFSNC